MIGNTLYIRMILSDSKIRTEIITYDGRLLTKEELDKIPAGQYKAYVREVDIVKTNEVDNNEAS